MPVFAPPRRWVLWLLVAYAVLAVVLLFSPVGPGTIVDAIMAWIHDDLGLTGVRQGWIEAPANVVLFAPLGLLLTLVFQHPWLGVAVAVVLSAGAELAQIVLPSRTPSLRDVVANVIGAVIGAAIAWAVIAHRRRRARPSATRRAG
jgi:VanZ family protein